AGRPLHLPNIRRGQTAPQRDRSRNIRPIEAGGINRASQRAERSNVRRIAVTVDRAAARLVDALTCELGVADTLTAVTVAAVEDMQLAIDGQDMTIALHVIVPIAGLDAQRSRNPAERSIVLLDCRKK